LSAEIGDEVSHGAVWSWVQKGRKTLGKEDDQRQKNIDTIVDRKFKGHG